MFSSSSRFLSSPDVLARARLLAFSALRAFIVFFSFFVVACVGTCFSIARARARTSRCDPASPEVVPEQHALGVGRSSATFTQHFGLTAKHLCPDLVAKIPAAGCRDRGRTERDAHERIRRALGPGHEAASIVRFEPHARKLKSLRPSSVLLFAVGVCARHPGMFIWQGRLDCFGGWRVPCQRALCCHYVR